MACIDLLAIIATSSRPSARRVAARFAHTMIETCQILLIANVRSVVTIVDYPPRKPTYQPSNHST
eukprot:271352-Amphidinium_carterae.1